MRARSVSRRAARRACASPRACVTFAAVLLYRTFAWPRTALASHVCLASHTTWFAMQRPRSDRAVDSCAQRSMAGPWAQRRQGGEPHDEPIGPVGRRSVTTPCTERKTKWRTLRAKYRAKYSSCREDFLAGEHSFNFIFARTNWRWKRVQLGRSRHPAARDCSDGSLQGGETAR